MRQESVVCLNGEREKELQGEKKRLTSEIVSSCTFNTQKPSTLAARPAAQVEPRHSCLQVSSGF